jgi:hypothetical protein
MNQPIHIELLSVQEREVFSRELAAYISIARNNTLASLQSHPTASKFIQLTDCFWQEALRGMDPITHEPILYPLFLYTTAHSCYRSAFLQLFSGAIVPASACLRTAIESVRHAHVITRYPASVENWLGMSGKGDEKTKRKNKSSFNSYLKKTLEAANEPFRLLDSHWRFFCDFGAHSSKLSVLGSMEAQETENETKFLSVYLHSNEKTLQVFRFRFSVVGYQSARLLYGDFQARLGLIPRIHRKFDRLQQSARELEYELNQLKFRDKDTVW